MDMDDNACGSSIGVVISMLAIATIAVILRTVSILSDRPRKLGLDDLFVTLSLFFYTSEAAMILRIIKLGGGHHEDAIPINNLAQIGILRFAAEFLFTFALALPKSAVLFFYYRIFGTSTRWFYVLLWVVGAINLAWVIVSCFTTAFPCKPIPAAWKFVPGSTCIPLDRTYIGTSVVSTVVDLAIIMMPVPMLLGLHVTRARRAQVVMVFLCGYCVIVTSVGRLITLAKLGNNLTMDFTWNEVTYIKWVQCECALSILSACLPNIVSFGRRLHQHGVRAALSGKSVYVQRDSFHKINVRTDWNVRVSPVPDGQVENEEELRVLTFPSHDMPARTRDG